MATKWGVKAMTEKQLFDDSEETKVLILHADLDIAASAVEVELVAKEKIEILKPANDMD